VSRCCVVKLHNDDSLHACHFFVRDFFLPAFANAAIDSFDNFSNAGVALASQNMRMLSDISANAAVMPYNTVYIYVTSAQ